MILPTDELREQLLANGRRRDADHVPVVKFFNPLGEGVWLATELDEDGDTLFGLADLGYPELGSFSIEEMSSLPCHSGWGSSATSSSPATSRSRSGPRRRGRPAAFAQLGAPSMPRRRHGGSAGSALSSPAQARTLWRHAA